MIVLELKPSDTRGNTLDSVSTHAKEAAKQVSEAAEERIDSERERAVEGLSGVADALRRAGSSMRKGKSRAPSTLIGRPTASNSCRITFVRRLFAKSLGGRGLARREPALFLGGAFLVGLVGVRFLKSSASSGSSDKSFSPSRTSSNGGRGNS